METMTRYLSPRLRGASLLLGCAVVLMALGAWLAFLAHERHEVRIAAQLQLAALRAAHVKKPVSEPTKAETETAKRWAALLAERDFRWAPLFAALENAGNPDIELLEFQPDKANRRVSLRGEARDEAALQAFLASLAGQGALQRPHLVHEKIRQRDRLSTIAFEIKAGLAAPKAALKPAVQSH